MQQETDAEMPMESAMSRLHPATCIQLFFPTASPADLQLPRLDSLILLSDVTSASGRSKLPDFPVSYPSSSCTPEGLAGGRIYLILQLFWTSLQLLPIPDGRVSIHILYHHYDTHRGFDFPAEPWERG